MENSATLYTAQELEELLGKKYFYRQSIYRMAEDKKISSYQVGGTLYFSSKDVTVAILRRLAERIRYRYSWLNIGELRVKYDENQGKIITIYGIRGGKKIIANTETEAEEDLLNKVGKMRKEVTSMPDIPVGPEHEGNRPPPPPGHQGPHDHGHGHHPPPPPHHREMMESLRRIEDRLTRIEEKVG